MQRLIDQLLLNGPFPTVRKPVPARKSFNSPETIAVRRKKRARKVRWESARQGLSGLEFATGIPGTVGGAAIMNAGAFDGQISSTIHTVTALNSADEKITILKNDLEFSYRSSSLMGSGLIVTEVEVILKPDDKKAIRKRMQEVQKLRKAQQPDGLSAGCIFKNPEGDSAGRLIDSCGLKGLFHGGAEISTKHANYIINRGTASYEDIKNLMSKIVETVHNKYNIELSPEIIDLGEQKNWINSVSK